MHDKAKDKGASEGRFNIVTAAAVWLRGVVLDARLAKLESQVDIVGNENGRDDYLDNVVELEPEETVS